MGRPFAAYVGDEPYIFVCYAHDNADVVYPELMLLQDQGVNIWYDEGISAGKIWRRELAEAIRGAAKLIYYISSASLQSAHCNREIEYALDKEIEVVPVYLEEIKLTPELDLALNRVQALHREQDVSYQHHLLKALGKSANSADSIPADRKKRTWPRYAAALAIGLMLAGIWYRQSNLPTEMIRQEAKAELSVPAVAILPLENLSPDPDNGFFAAGVHDDLITQLAKISSLKVISRTSVLEYRDRPKNMRVIGQELGVDAVLVGAVRRAGDTIRINVQLIDAQTDNHLWAETYDRELTPQNVFALQSEIATSIVGALNGTLSPHELARLNDVPTRSTRAYDFYLLGNEYFRSPNDSASLQLALRMYERACEEDPEFAQAFARASHAHSMIYWHALDRTDSRLKLAAEAFQHAFELMPDLPEAHFAAGQYHYRGFRDYDRALVEYSLGEGGMPGSAELAMAKAEIYRRLGLREQALASWERAIDLDPRNPLPLFQHAMTSIVFRDYAQAEEYYLRGVDIDPDFPWPNFNNSIPMVRDGDPTLVLETDLWGWWARLYQRDHDAQLEYIDQRGNKSRSTNFGYLSKSSLFGVAYQLAGQPAVAETYFKTARIEIAQALAENPADPRLLIALGETMAGMGENENAAQVARQAIALRPTSSDAFQGPVIQRDAILRVLIPAGYHEAALEGLDAYLESPGMWSIEGMLPDPRLDPIRDNPRFRALVKKHRRVSE